MAQITRIQAQQPTNFGQQALQLGGAGIGAYFGGAQGAAAGSSLGSAAGGLVAQQNPTQTAQDVGNGGSAFQRRMSELNNDNQKQIADSINSLQYVQDPQQRAELAKPLLQAQYVAQRQG